MYIIRLDDMSDHRDVDKWHRMELLLNKYSVCPIFGIIPDNHDPELLVYPKDGNYWMTVASWIANGWEPAMHGYQHLYNTEAGGINPINNYSEFAEIPLDTQKKMIADGFRILKEHDIVPEIFFAPAHTYDENTLIALKEQTSISVISDTVALDVYFSDGFYYIPQQTGKVRKLPLNTVTFCYHPNTMTNKDFEDLEDFLRNNKAKFGSYRMLTMNNRKKSAMDKLLQNGYFGIRRLRRWLKNGR